MSENPKITYPDCYNEPITIVKELLEITDTIPKKAAVEILLIFHAEISQNWYKAKCTAANYCITQYADSANGYAKAVDVIRKRILRIFEEVQNDETTSL